MRRKSERNKAKSSPEKKPEKPTRKSTRRRAKKSPSTTPERDNSNEEESPVIDKESSSQKIQTRNQSKELPAETIIEEAESKVTSSDHINEDVVVEDSVWKVSRQDASPGEIQKLRLRRQRNLSETSSEASTTMSRKRLYRLQEGSESGSVAEEADSADERIVKVATPDVTDDTSSTITKLDTTGEEVSHKMENPPSQQTYDMSDDVKRHVDGEGTSYQRAKVDHKPADDVKLQEAKDDGELTTNQPLDGQEKTTDQQQDQDKRQDEEVREDVRDEKIQEKTKKIDEKSEEIEDESVKAEEKTDISDEKHENLEEKSEKSEETETKTQEIPEVSEKIQEKTVNDEKSKDKSVENEESKREKSQEKEEESAKSDDDKSRKDLKSPDSSPSSDDNSRKSVRSTRRKHRDKYRDSSNSDSGDSEDESRRRRRGKEKEEVKREEVIVQKSEEEEDNGGRKEENVKSVEKCEEKVPEKEEKPVESEKVEVEKAQGGNNVCRPAKVNLKRSYTPRISTDESTKKNDADGVNDATQNKENHATDDTKVVPKRRRWGAALSTDTAPVLSISTDSLKALVPGAKPLSLNEVRLTKDDDEDRERRKERNNQSVEREKTKDEPKANNDPSKDNHLGARRKISIVKDTPQLKSPSPPLAQPTSILLIKNLVRPFTLNQIKELLSRTGTIVENGFWMDRIKSKCFVEYSNEDQAFETRQALHGISWPMSNPKKLIVEYSTKEEMEKVKETSKDQAPLRKVEASSGAEVWQQDWSRDEKTNSTTKVTVVREWDLGKEDGQHLLPKDKDKKELDKKKRARSRSPTLEAHLPAPARKFKKKEDEPPPAKLLDDLFRKTKATPCIYWLPLTNEQIVVKEEMRRQHMAEHARRLEEMRRAERNRDSRRRRSPRK